MLKSVSEIVCATDFQHVSYSAEKVAYLLSEKLGWNLTLVHCDYSMSQFHDLYIYNGVMFPPGLSETIREKFSDNKIKKLEHLKHAIGAAGSPLVHTKLLAGSPTLELLNYIQRSKSRLELLVLSKRKRSFLGEFFLGSVALRLIEILPHPTLVVPDRHEIFVDWKPKKILVATSLQEGSIAALEFAGKIARAFESQVTLLHVRPAREELENVDAVSALSIHEKQELTAVLESQEEVILKLLNHEKNKLMLDEGNAETMVRAGSPLEMILETAAQLQVDLIVVGAYTKASKSHIGSVAASLCRTARVPALIVKTQS